MNKDELLSIIQANRRESLGHEDGQLSVDRAKAMDHYHGRPYGNEKSGRSSVVTKDLSETVDWMMPSIMDVFVRAGTLVEFVPTGEEDEEAAQQEAEYINHLIMVKNDGFLELHDWFKDALILKNGYIKHWWDESEEIENEEYEGLSSDDLMLLMQEFGDAEVEIKSHEVEIVNDVETYSVELQIKRKVSRLMIQAVPAEEVRVSKRCRGNLQQSPFTEHVTQKTRTELIEMGMDKDFVAGLASVSDENNDLEEYARDSIANESDDYNLSFDRTMDEIEYCEAYIRVDYDGDGVAELRKVITVADKIPPGEEWNEPVDAVAITSITPKRVPHRHVGESLDDDLDDLQEIHTTLTRQLLDNVYRTNNTEYIVNSRVHQPDFMQSLPGGIKRILDDGPVSGCVEPVQTTPIVGQLLPAIDYVEGLKENRTGVSRSSNGLDPDVLKQSTEGAYIESLNKASRKVEMIVRMFAETGVKELVRQVRALVAKHQNKEEIVKLSGKYVPINPRDWKNRTDMRVKVGLGNGTEEDKRNRLMLIASLQEKLAAYNLVSPQNAINLFKEISNTLGFNAPEKYIVDINSPEYQQMSQPQSNPLAEAEQVKAQAAMQISQIKEQNKSQIEAMKQQSKAEMELLKQQNQIEIDRIKEQAKLMNDEADRKSREAIETAKLEFQAMMEGFKVDIGEPGLGAELDG